MGQVLHAHAEHPVDQNEHRVIPFHQIDEAGLHTRRSGGGHGNRQGVLRIQQRAQIGLDGVHDADKVRVQMTEGFLAQGRVNLVMHAGGTGAH